MSVHQKRKQPERSGTEAVIRQGKGERGWGGGAGGLFFGVPLVLTLRLSFENLDLAVA